MHAATRMHMLHAAVQEPLWRMSPDRAPLLTPACQLNDIDAAVQQHMEDLKQAWSAKIQE